MAVTLMPMTLAGALLGQLLGRERFHRLAIATVTMAGARLVSGLVAAAAGWGLSGALAALALATILVVLGMCFLADVPEWWRRRVRLAVADLRDLAGAAGGVAAFLVLTNVDSVLARHHLPAATSGIYVLGALFAKAGLWGPQFIAVVAFPRLAGPDRDRLLRRAALATAGFGLLIAVGGGSGRGPLVRIVSGDEYSARRGYAPAFALLGTVFALVNLGLLAHVAASGDVVHEAAVVGRGGRGRCRHPVAARLGGSDRGGLQRRRRGPGRRRLAPCDPSVAGARVRCELDLQHSGDAEWARQIEPAIGKEVPQRVHDRRPRRTRSRGGRAGHGPPPRRRQRRSPREPRPELTSGSRPERFGGLRNVECPSPSAPP